ncbi:MAG: hypothetical protein ACM358_06610 [Gemmatimonadota bacterium]
MSPGLLGILIAGPTAAVVVAMFYVFWSARSSPQATRVALVAGVVLAVWAAATAVLATTGFYAPASAESFPPTGAQFGIALVALAVALAISPSLRSLLSNQRHVLRLNVWRLVGIVFIALWVTGQVPALWAIPTGVGDIIVGATAFWVASRFERPGGRRLAVLFNLFGLADLFDAVALGIMTNPGPLQAFHTTPTSELVTHFPLALVPGFLVPLAIMLHVVSLWQLARGSWARPGEAAHAVR